MSVGAWVGDTAVGRARAEAAGDEPDEAGGAGPSSWRELVAALVALRAEVAAVRHVPVVALDPAAPAGELLDGQPARALQAAAPGMVWSRCWADRRGDRSRCGGDVVECTAFLARGSGALGAVVITKVVHGWRPAGLLAYLLGPGTAEVHQAPRVIATWDGLDAGGSRSRRGRGSSTWRSGR